MANSSAAQCNSSGCASCFSWVGRLHRWMSAWLGQCPCCHLGQAPSFPVKADWCHCSHWVWRGGSHIFPSSTRFAIGLVMLNHIKLPFLSFKNGQWLGCNSVVQCVLSMHEPMVPIHHGQKGNASDLRSSNLSEAFYQHGEVPPPPPKQVTSAPSDDHSDSEPPST